MGLPQVSIGLPVRNSISHYGESVFRQVIGTILNQTYGNLEILISDNASNDETPLFCQEVARGDSRVRFVQQGKPLTAQEHFRYVFDQTKGPYFTWAADDDFRSLNSIEILVDALNHHPGACLAFSNEVEFSDHANYQSQPFSRRDFQTVGLSITERLQLLARGNCTYLCYGLMRREVLARFHWQELENSSFDVPMGHFLTLCKDFVYVPGAVYYRYIPPRPKSLESRAHLNNYCEVRPFFPERFAWKCTRAVMDACRETGQRPRPLRHFCLIYSIQQQGFKGMVYRWAPVWLRASWKGLKAISAKLGLPTKMGRACRGSGPGQPEEPVEEPK